MTEKVGRHSRFHAVRVRLETMAVEPGPRGWFLEFLVFVFKQGWACLFGGLMLAPKAEGLNLLVYLIPLAAVLTGGFIVWRTVRRWTAGVPANTTNPRP